MSKSMGSKAKLLYLARILIEETDENHPLSTPALIERLSACGIDVERKTLYDDIETLESFGLDVQTIKSRANLYFVGSNNLELPELKLLVDAVSSSRFITEKKSAQLIEKLSKMTSSHNARSLRRQVFVSGRVKTPNEQIYYNIDAIHNAISKSKQIAFKYFEWTIDKKQEFKRNGEEYIQSPLGLSLSDNNYYLITYSAKHNKILHFRVDKMSNISVTDTIALKPDFPFDIAEYSNKTFNMFGGDDERVELLVHNSLIGVMIDRFGKDITTIKKDDEHFIAILNVSASPMFLGWLFSFGDKVKVLSPERVVDKIKALSETVNKIYK